MERRPPLVRRALGRFVRSVLLSCVMASHPGCGDDEDGYFVDVDPQLPPPIGAGQAAPASLGCLRSWELENSLWDLYGLAIDPEIRRRPDLVRANFTSVSARLDCYDDIDVETLEQIALDISARAFGQSPTPLEVAGCGAHLAPEAYHRCVDGYFKHFITRAFRRPASDSEIAKYTGLAQSLAGLFDGYLPRGVELASAAVIQSPYFVYRVELGDDIGDGSGRRLYTSDEMASRLSFTLWGQPPDHNLRELARLNRLRDPEEVRRQAERMVFDPRADAMLVHFWREHLAIDRLNLENYSRQGADAQLYHAMRNEALEIAWAASQPGQSAMQFLSHTPAQSPALRGYLYGTVPGPRRGYLTSALFLTSTGHPDGSSPTRRGKFVLDRLLCTKVPPPPADVDLELPEVEEGEATTRQLLEAHSSSPACRGCHLLIDPIGFGFEHYDQLGRYRTIENGLPVEAAGVFAGRSFSDGAQLAALIEHDPRTRRCLTVQALRWASGQLETEAQEPYFEAFTTTMATHNDDLRRLLVDVVSSEAFRYASGFIGD